MMNGIHGNMGYAAGSVSDFRDGRILPQKPASDESVSFSDRVSLSAENGSRTSASVSRTAAPLLPEARREKSELSLESLAGGGEDSAWTVSSSIAGGIGGKITGFFKHTLSGLFSKPDGAQIDSLAGRYTGETMDTAYYVAGSGLHESGKAQKYDMSFDDLVWLCDYTSNGYQDINRALRTGDETELGRLGEIIDKTAAALDKLPSHRGRVFRGAHMPESFFEEHQVGARVTYDAFTSTSRSPFKKFDGNTVMTIRPCRDSGGKNVSWLSRYSYEKEVLFPPGTDFVVTGHSERFGKHYITLQEVPDSGGS